MKIIVTAFSLMVLTISTCEAKHDDEKAIVVRKNQNATVESCIKKYDPHVEKLDSPTTTHQLFKLTADKTNPLKEQNKHKTTTKGENILVVKPAINSSNDSTIDLYNFVVKNTADQSTVPINGVFNFSPEERCVFDVANLKFNTTTTQCGTLACKDKDALIKQINARLKENNLGEITENQFVEKEGNGQNFFFKDVYIDPTGPILQQPSDPLRAVIAYSCDKNTSNLYLGTVMIMGADFSAIKEISFVRALGDFFKNKNNQNCEKKLENSTQNYSNGWPKNHSCGNLWRNKHVSSGNPVKVSRQRRASVSRGKISNSRSIKNAKKPTNKIRRNSN